jgi:phosphoglycolate phosphatase-like HAD superfamily hydrolase
VLLDVDGTLCDNTPRLIEYVEAECGVELTREQITEWSFSIPGTDVDIGDLLHRAIDERPEWFLLGMEPIDGAAEAARWLRQQGHTVRIATHRPAESHPITAQWLDEHDVPHDEVIDDVPQNKGRLAGDILIDDYHVNVKNALAAGKEAGLFVQPYSDPRVCDEAVVAETWSTMLAELGRTQPVTTDD